MKRNIYLMMKAGFLQELGKKQTIKKGIIMMSLIRMEDISLRFP